MNNKSVKQVCDYLIADVPFPPSINALYKVHKIGNRCSIGKSKEYKAYRDKTFANWWLKVRQAGRIDFGDRVMVWSIMCLPRSNCDLDNYYKCFLDSLQAAGGIANDKHVMSIRNEKGPRVSGGLMRIFIANERYWLDLPCAFDREYTEWLKHDLDGPILKQPDQYLLRRAGFAESAQSTAEYAPLDTDPPF